MFAQIDTVDMASDTETQAWTFGGLGTWAAANVVNATAELANHIPGVGHCKAGYMYYAWGDAEGAARVCRQATRTTAVVSAGVFSPVAAGLTGAAVFAVGVGAGYDYALTSLDRANYGEDFPASGHVESIEQVTGYLQGRNELTAAELARYSGRIALDMALGMTAAQLSNSLLTPSPIDVAASGMGGGAEAAANHGNRLGLDKAGLDNRSNQLNPNHLKSGPGRSAGYHGSGTQADLNNHANQLNQNNARYWLSRSSSSGMGESQGLDQAGLNNRANQLNPNHLISGPGPGRFVGYHWLGTPADLNNHANQINPNNALYWFSRSSLG